MVQLLKTEGPVSVWFSWPFPRGFKIATVAPGITSAFKTRRKKDVARQICHALSGQQKLIQSLVLLPPPADIHLLNISLNFCIIQFNSVAQSCPILCNPMDCGTVALKTKQTNRKKTKQKTESRVCIYPLHSTPPEWRAEHLSYPSSQAPGHNSNLILI